jgi:hypothetical protein
MEHKYWTYIVASLSGTLYIGMTNNIGRRLWEHKSGEFEGLREQISAIVWSTTRDLTSCGKPSIAKSNLKAGGGQRRLRLSSHALRAGRIWPRNGDGRWRFPANRLKGAES